MVLCRYIVIYETLHVSDIKISQHHKFKGRGSLQLYYHDSSGTESQVTP